MPWSEYYEGGEKRRPKIRLVSIINEFNQITGGKILIGNKSFVFLNGNDDHLAFREDFTQSWLKVHRTRVAIGWVQVEVDLSGLT